MNTAKKAWQSIKLTGGASVNIATDKVNPNTGWMVSLSGHEKRYPIPETFEQFQAITKPYLLEVLPNRTDRLNLVLDDKTKFIGYWSHENELYVDISVHFEDFIDAMDFATINKQIAIWDCGNKREFSFQSNLTRLVNENSQK